MSALKNLACELGMRRLGISSHVMETENIGYDDMNSMIINAHTYYKKRCLECSHIAAIFACKNPTMSTLLAIGENRMAAVNHRVSVHAEEDVINKLKPMGRNRIINVNMLIVCVTETGKFHDSHPCVHCKKMMMERPNRMGYRINRIYYTTNSGDIEVYTMNNLLLSEKVHVSKYYRRTNYNMEKWLKWRDSIVIVIRIKE